MDFVEPKSVRFSDPKIAGVWWIQKLAGFGTPKLWILWNQKLAGFGKRMISPKRHGALGRGKHGFGRRSPCAAHSTAFVAEMPVWRAKWCFSP